VLLVELEDPDELPMLGQVWVVEDAPLEAGVVVEVLLFVAAVAIADPTPKVSPGAPAAIPAAKSRLLLNRTCPPCRVVSGLGRPRRQLIRVRCA
jgi:hypothetical protein